MPDGDVTAPIAHTIIAAEHVSLTLQSKAGPVDILHDVSLAVRAGESVGIVGRSGSGKSSLLSLLAGLEQPTKGRVIAARQDLTTLDEDGLARFRRDHVGIVFQSFHLIPTMTALENVTLPLELAGLMGGGHDGDAQAKEFLASVGLGDRFDHYPDQLSGGEQQRVAIARALISRPNIILADEPTGNLDDTVGQQIADILFTLPNADISVTKPALILVTHDTVLAKRCDRVLEMVDGHLHQHDEVLLNVGDPK